MCNVCVCVLLCVSSHYWPECCSPLCDPDAMLIRSNSKKTAIAHHHNSQSSSYIVQLLLLVYYYYKKHFMFQNNAIFLSIKRLLHGVVLQSCPTGCPFVMAGLYIRRSLFELDRVSPNRYWCQYWVFVSSCNTQTCLSSWWHNLVYHI